MDLTLNQYIWVQLYTRWCLWTQLYRCTIWCIYGVHIMDLTLYQNMWVQFYTRWCLWTQLHYVSYGVFEPNFKPKNVGPNMRHKMWLQLYTIWCVGPTSYQIGAYMGKEITKLLLTVNCVFNHLVAESIYSISIV